MFGEGLVREVQRFEAAIPARVDLIVHVREPERAAVRVVVDQPHAAAAAFRLLDHVLREPAEETFEVGFADEEIQRELNHFGLHRRQTLGAAALVVLTRQRGAKDLGVGRGQFRRRGSLLSAAQCFLIHAVIIEQFAPPRIVQKS
jgi:hypothetical protein